MTTIDPAYRYALNKYAVNGSQIDFNIKFDGGQIAVADIAAFSYVTADYSDQHSEPVSIVTILADGSSGTARVTPAVPSGRTLVIYRQTPIGLPLVDFINRSMLTELNLNTVTEQAIYSVAELHDSFGELQLKVNDLTEAALTDAASALDVASDALAEVAAANATANTALNTANSAVAQVQGAITAAEDATAAASLATDAATVASAAASAATALVTSIQGEVDAAVDTANAASDTANEASDAALALSGQITDAVHLAQAASDTANGVDAKATTALAHADEALAAATVHADTTTFGTVRYATDSEAATDAQVGVVVTPKQMRAQLAAKAALAGASFTGVVSAPTFATSAPHGGYQFADRDTPANTATWYYKANQAHLFTSQIGGDAFSVNTVNGTVTAVGPFNGKVINAVGPDAVMQTASGSQMGLMVSSPIPNVSSSAFMAFNRNGAYAVYFGLRNDNNLCVGGWSMGASTWRIVHEGLANPVLNGNTTSGGGFQSGSDERLKTNLKPIKGALELVLSLHPVRGRYLKKVGNADYRKPRFFITAQDALEAGLGEMVAQDALTVKGKKYHTVDYDQGVPLLVQALKDLHAELQELKEKFNER